MCVALPKQVLDLVPIAEILAEAGGAVLHHYWGAVLKAKDKKEVGNIVTEVDEESEREILAILKSECPSHAVHAEETGKQIKKSDFLWMIDPLDGTVNYAHQYPMVSVSVSLLYKNKPVIGVVYNPILNEWFQAVQGQGAFLNGEQIHVSKVKKLEKSLLATGFAYDRRETEDNNYAEFAWMTNIAQGVRRGGSAALDLAYVAAGRFDGYWERGIKPWDISAGMVLVQEAGGTTSHYDGSSVDFDTGRILATNGHLHNKLISELKKVKGQYERKSRKK